MSPRYNSKDSPWWWAVVVQDYAASSPEGLDILDAKVARRFPTDQFVKWDSPEAYSTTSTVAEILHEILSRHAAGIHFTEYCPPDGTIDEQMRKEGFNVDIEVDWDTGFVKGGNRYNCGTWQDKMGSSAKAGNKGLPATPRDGAAVECTGLLKSTLRWIVELQEKGKWKWEGVEATVKGQNRTVTYKEWNDLIQANFERCYWVPVDPSEDSKYAVDSSIVNRRGIYKDVYGSGQGREWSDYQLRSNFPVAMTVAPELFDPQHALQALKVADEVLRGPLGMKTLDPNDMQYNGDYNNADDSENQQTAQGWNYHQGPEWVWPIGYFLRAFLYFDSRYGSGKDDVTETLQYIHAILLPHGKHIRDDAWAGLPELTNKDGAYCHDSCHTQAWSASTILDLLEDVSKVQIKAH